MTPAQMLRRGSITVAPLVPRPVPLHESAFNVHPSGDHIVRVVAPPAQGIRIMRSAAEPWFLEQLHLGACPTCAEHILHMVCPLQPGTHFYVCEDEPKLHRWTILED
jgi:hypothetical protein